MEIILIKIVLNLYKKEIWFKALTLDFSYRIKLFNSIFNHLLNTVTCCC